MDNFPLVPSNHFYSREIVFDVKHGPYWAEKQPSLCRCGKASCDDCGTAFDVWFTEKVKSIFAANLKNLYCISFHINFLSHHNLSLEDGELGWLEEFVRKAIDIPELTERIWLGVFDVLTFGDYPSDKTMNWSVYAFMITTMMTPNHIKLLKKTLNEKPNIEFTMPRSAKKMRLRSPPDAKTDYLIPADYAYWVGVLKFKALRQPEEQRQVRQNYLATGLQSDRLVLVNLRRAGSELILK